MFKLGAMLFDAYGTLFDLGSLVKPYVTRLGDPPRTGFDRQVEERTNRFLALWRQKQLEYSWTATLRGEYQPFDTITRAALDYALERELSKQQRAEDPTLGDDLMRSFARLEPDRFALEVLQALKTRGLRLGILSNGTAAMLAELLKWREIAQFLEPDLILSVDAVKVYKPDRRVYQLGLDALKIPAEEIGFVSGNAWDAAGAAKFGFDTYWIGRSPEEYGLGRKVSRLESLYHVQHAIP
jgi:2-haloacid dehalogenase